MPDPLEELTQLRADIRAYRWRVFAAYILIVVMFAAGLFAYRFQDTQESVANQQQDDERTQAVCEAQNDLRREIIRLAAPSPELHAYMSAALPLLDCSI